MEHITFERIYAYMEGQIEGSEAGEVSGHLVFCERCNKLFAGLKDMGDMLGRCFKIRAGGNCPEDWEIAAFTKHEVEPALSEKIKEHINRCDSCLGRAALYHKTGLQGETTVKTPQEWVEMAIHILQGDEIQPKKDSILKRIYNRIGDIASALPPLPGYAIATVAIALLIWGVFSKPVRVMTLPSTQRIVITDVDASSSFAFMEGEEKKEMKEFEGMDVKRAGKNLAFSWKPTLGMEASEFALKKKGIEKDAFITTLSVKGNVVTIPIEKFQYNERYEWVISGHIEDSRRFEAMGEFIVMKK